MSSNDTKTNLKAHHGQHSDNKPPKQSRFSFIGFISAMACLVILLLITSCQPTDPKIFVSKEVAK